MKYQSRIVTGLIAGVCLAGFVSCRNASSTESDKKPNVVFILADDLGWNDLGCYGSDFYETPQIDRLATEGVRFTNAYSACHVCSPTRASIITGQYPARLGLTDWLPGRKNFPFQRLQNVRSEQHLPFDQRPLPLALKEQGYNTAIIGKWHLGEDSASTERQGFDLHIPNGWKKGWPKTGYFSPYGLPGLEDGPEGEYLTDRITDEALKYIENQKDSAFFLYLAHFAVHDQIQGRPDLVKKYEEKLKSTKVTSGAPYILEGNPDDASPLSRNELDAALENDEYKGFSILPNRTVKIKQRQNNVQFAAMVESLDESVGRILQKLQELGIDDNTIVVFFSDNGGMSAANFGNPQRKILPENLDKAFSTSNLPFRGGKGWLYEGGVRVPLIIKWPGVTEPGKIEETPTISVDFYSTLLEMTGVQKSQGINGQDGISLVPLLNNQSIANRPIFWHFPHYSNHGAQSPGGAVRYGDYKLIEYFENNAVQLFNVVSDPGEQNDLSKVNPEKVEELKEILHKWRLDVNAEMMEPNPEFKLAEKIETNL